MLDYIERIVYSFMWLVIGAVSAIDTYWSVELGESLYADEMNPVGRLIMSLDGGGVALFMGLKFMGTVFVLGYFVYIFSKSKNFAWSTIVPIFLLQLMLLVYLYTGFNF